MLAGGIGDGAVNKLASQNIQVIRNCKGDDVHQLVEDYLAGKFRMVVLIVLHMLMKENTFAVITNRFRIS